MAQPFRRMVFCFPFCGSRTCNCNKAGGTPPKTSRRCWSCYLPPPLPEPPPLEPLPLPELLLELLPELVPELTSMTEELLELPPPLPEPDPPPEPEPPPEPAPALFAWPEHALTRAIPTTTLMSCWRFKAPVRCHDRGAPAHPAPARADATIAARANFTSS